MSKSSIDTLIGIVTDCTGVINHKIRILVLYQFKSGTFQNSGKLLGISGVHLTAKGRYTAGCFPSKLLRKSFYIAFCFFDIIQLSLLFVHTLPSDRSYTCASSFFVFFPSRKIFLEIKLYTITTPVAMILLIGTIKLSGISSFKNATFAYNTS